MWYCSRVPQAAAGCMFAVCAWRWTVVMQRYLYAFLQLPMTQGGCDLHSMSNGWRWLQVKILSGCTAKLIPCEASLPGIWVWQLYCHQDHLVFLPLTLQAVKHSAGSIAFRYPHSLFNYIACHHCSTLLYNFFSQCAKWNCDPHHMFMRTVWAAFECSWDERIWLNVALPGIHGSFICNSGLLVLKFWIEVAFSDGCFIIIWLNWLPVSYDIHI